MTILVAGATGATGRLLVHQLLKEGHSVRVIVRSSENLTEFSKSHEHLTVITAPILNLNRQDLMRHVSGCDAVASCLGHNISFRGIYGKPRRLVTDAVYNLCLAVIENNPPEKVKFVLMNTTGNRNREINEKHTVGEKMVFSLMRLLLPPMSDNEKSADFLQKEIGTDDSHISWAAVRPDTLIDEQEVGEYRVFPSPVRSPVFNAGKTSRINVAHFMSRLITDDDLWNKWEGQMPVIYNREG